MWPLGVTILATSCAIDNGSALKTSHKILAVRVANLEIIGHIVVLLVKICFSMRSLYFFSLEFDLCMIRPLSGLPGESGGAMSSRGNDRTGESEPAKEKEWH